MTTEQAREYVAELYDAWYLTLVRYTRQFVRQHSSAEEIVQDTFLDLYKALRAGQQVEHPKAWTMCVARRKIQERWNAPFSSERTHEALDALEMADQHGVAAMEERIDCSRVREHLQLLTAREQEALLLRLEAMKYREIAGALGVTVTTVNTLLARALVKLRTAVVVGRDKAGQRRIL